MVRSFRSVAAGGTDLAGDVAEYAYQEFAGTFPEKLYWFMSKGYLPHEWQSTFHAAHDVSNLIRFRHLVAGRRGGKTMSAAWETLFYCLHPRAFHFDAHGADSSRPLWVWVLTKDHEVGLPARVAMQEAIQQAGLEPGRDYKFNKTSKTYEFYANGDGETLTAFLQFRTADDPQSLRGAGLDILWIDEAAFIRDDEAWNVARPALSDKLGLVITTTTPKGKNWFYERFFRGDAMKADNQFRVEYVSIDNPYFPHEEWLEAKRTMHPALFKQEFMASFDSMDGLTLSGDWLHYYTIGKVESHRAHIDVQLPRGEDGRYRLRKYIGVDPSTGEAKDEFAIALIGVEEDFSAAYVLEMWSGKIQFPEQVEMIQDWHTKYRPEVIGVESNVFQRVLAQQASRIESFPPIARHMSTGKKNDRIIAMAPVFKLGKVRIHQRMHTFIDQWVSFDAERKDNRDDCLDAVEIALSTAGVLLPLLSTPAAEKEPKTIHEEAWEQIKGLKSRGLLIDPELGSEG